VSDDREISVNILKLPHHGAWYYNLNTLIEKISPKYAISSSGFNNSYGLPKFKTVKLFSEKNIKLFRTDIHGSIEFVINDKGIKKLD